MQKANNQDKDKIINSLLKQISQQENAITSLLALQQRIKTYAIDDLHKSGILITESVIQQKKLENYQVQGDRAISINKKYLLVDISQCNQTISLDKKAHITDIDIILGVYKWPKQHKQVTANQKQKQHHQALKADKFEQLKMFYQKVENQMKKIKGQLQILKTKDISMSRVKKNKLQPQQILNQIISTPSKKKNLEKIDHVIQYKKQFKSQQELPVSASTLPNQLYQRKQFKKEAHPSNLSQPSINNKNLEKQDQHAKKNVELCQSEIQSTPKNKQQSVQNSSSKKKPKIYFIRH